MRTISGIIGLILILTAVVIVVLSTGDNSYAMKKEQMVAKYITNANNALDENDYISAKKFAKMAIQADPTNNNGFKLYEKVMEAKFKPSFVPEIPNGGEESPVQEEIIEEAPDMGC